MAQPTSIVVILNASAGTATRNPDLDTELADLFRTFGYEAEVIQLRAGQNPTDVARDASARVSIVVAGGGDGTVSGVAAALVSSKAALGVLPLGTLNHFAKDLHIPLDLREAVAVVAARHIERVDVGEVNGRIFINNASIGLYPSIVEERESLRRQGHRKWPATAIATLRVLRRYRGVTVRMEVDGRQRTWQTPFVLVANNEYAIDGIALGGRARLDQNKLFVYLTPRSRTRDLPMLVAKAVVGRASQSGAFEIVAATELTIDTRMARRIRVALDGELMTMSVPLKYRTCTGALQVVVPLG
jgi:diacylglycerol kinase family enzyme